MNSFQLELYNSLMALVTERELFYTKDHELDGVGYRVFSYHMGSYTDFIQPNALECRGIMFRMKSFGSDEPEALVSMPFQKFFNLGENPMAMNLDFSKVIGFEEKADGSMISTYIHVTDKYDGGAGELRLKSKTALGSLMANDAMAYINSEEHADLHAALEHLEYLGNTVIMEWCDPKPESRIVLFYEQPQLRVFGVRNRATGEIIDFRSNDADKLGDIGINLEGEGDRSSLEIIRRYAVETYTPDDAEKFANDSYAEKGIEGYIMVFEDGFRVKLKTDWYCTQHRLKDSVTNAVALFCSVVSGSSDDLKGIFHDNPGAVNIIEEMEAFAIPLYKHFVHVVENYHAENKHKDRKTYAIEGQKELTSQQFHVAMSLYLGKEIDYSETLTKYAKMYVNEYNGHIAEGTVE